MEPRWVLRREIFSLFFARAAALPGASVSLVLERMQKKIAAAATGGILSPLGNQDGNPGCFYSAIYGLP
jgi:hypothetical protein